MAKTSKLSGFYKLSPKERLKAVSEFSGLTEEEASCIGATGALSLVGLAGVRLLALLELFTQARQVGGDDGGGELDAVGHASPFSRSRASLSASATRTGAVPPGTSRAAIDECTSMDSASLSNRGEKRRYSSSARSPKAFC